MLSPSTIALRNPIVPNDVDHPDSFKQNMAASIPVPRMSSVHHDSLHFRSYHHRPSYSLTRSSVDRGSSSHSSSHHSHPYSRTSLQSSHRRTPSKEHPPRLTLPPPNTSNSRNFPSSREREYPRPPPPDYVWDSSATDARRPPSSSGGTERERTPSRRPASGGKSSYALPPLRSISNSNASGASPKIPPIAAMAPPSRDLPPAGRKSPHHRVPPHLYYDYEYHQQQQQQMYYPHDHHHPQTATLSGYREHETYREDMYDYRGPPASFPPRFHYSPAYQQAYDAPSPPLRTVEQLHPVTASYPHMYSGSHEMGRSRSQSSLPGASRPSTEGEETSTGEPVNQGQSRRLAHLMSEQKRRESINSGFQALRAALPTSLTTDSKAVILRKAVSRISYLEGLLQKNNISFSNGATNSGGSCEDQEGKKEI
ncbi:hypothetical protein J008_00800 [Cryptococcus neoformans]|uniref:BHLH domain-containing protein n=1 Tax=Cryptococcus neoformans Tu259-1 TaxID=1230072 RepID=A0A854QM83_CRYNE|nr:hypothetical protein C362_05009 [Cryptococcus neoformans var. grubii Bt1]OWZ55242.1 hypothetical protein C353_00811 [Cryptococcus neoformans var. grubii AD1-83a]OWZ58144.1 hypothetical protein C368_01318 [Cryptococcus neoformans var. grubii 125.91]OWZ69051.1 hypothetical protein AYX15_00230 [Cryptococcus neoformans var. grubii]OXG29148.1 hypothetical protein C361_00804 [Cryptococcus neoformans var. grubii Tu259-1]OXG34197.1 hypothetical protein C367_00805 [Cryptococcus neoformans var. grubi